MSEQMTHPGVGVGVYIVRDDKVLLGKRKTSQSGTWCPPGGKLDMYETWEECGAREVFEETGLKVTGLRFLAATNDMSPEDGRHYITLHLVAGWSGGEATVTEPDKLDSWEWFAWDALPEPLFLSTRNFVKSGYNPLNFN